MKLPSKKYREAVAMAILELGQWQRSWYNAEPASKKSFQYRVWYTEAKIALAELGIFVHSDDDMAELRSELAEAERDLEECLELERIAKAAEAAKRAAEVEQAEAELAALRTEVLEAEGSSVDPSDYTAVALWGEVMGSYPYYIEAEQRRASNDGAPLSAIYKRDDGRWATVHDIQNEPLKAQLLAALAEIEEAV